MSGDWKSEILRDFASWLVDLPPDGEPPVAPAARRGLSDLLSAVSKLGREVALQNRASKQAVMGLEATNAELSRMRGSFGAQRSALQALISRSEPGGGRSPRDLAVGFLEIRDSLVRSQAMVEQAEAAMRAGNPPEDRVHPEPKADAPPPTEPRARDDLHGSPPEDRPALANVQTQGDVVGRSGEDDPVPTAQRVQADDSVQLREERPVPAGPRSRDGLQPATREEGPAPAERPGSETDEIAQYREIVANIAGALGVVVRKIDAILNSQGIAAFRTVGRPFDPAVMSVVGTREVPGVPPGIVVEEVRGGFLMCSRVLRSAEVFVNRIHANRRGGE